MVKLNTGSKNPNLVYKAKKYFILNFGAVIIFAVLYWLSDVFETKYPKFSKKYLGVTDKLSDDWNSANSFVYYLRYSLVTQTTVGYGGIVSKKGRLIHFNDLDYPFQILNILQLMSIFLIPIVSLLI